MTAVLVVIGVLFILNGVSSMRNSGTVEKVRAQMPEGCDIYLGNAKGILFFSSTDAMIAVSKNGRIAKAVCIQNIWLKKAKASDLHLEGKKMEKINQLVDDRRSGEKKACYMALRQYTKRRK